MNKNTSLGGHVTSLYSEESKLFRSKITVNEDSMHEMCIKVADSRNELEDAYRLTHNMYVRMGFMDPQPNGLRLSIFHAMPFTQTFVGKRGNDVVMNTTLYPDSFLGLPMEKLYSDEIELLRSQGRFIGEIGALVSLINNQNAVLHLVKIILNYAGEYVMLDDVLITVHPKHKNFYIYTLGFEQIGEEKKYEMVNDRPAVLLRLDLHKFRDFCFYAYPRDPVEHDLYHFFFESDTTTVVFPQVKAPYNVWNEQLIRYFFVEKTNLITESDDPIKMYFKTVYNCSC